MRKSVLRLGLPHPLEAFLKGKANVERVGGSTWAFEPGTLPSELTYVTLEYLQ